MKHLHSVPRIYFFCAKVVQSILLCKGFWEKMTTARIFSTLPDFPPPSAGRGSLSLNDCSPREFMVVTSSTTLVKIRSADFGLRFPNSEFVSHLGSPRSGYLSTVLGTCPI